MGGLRTGAVFSAAAVGTDPWLRVRRVDAAFRVSTASVQALRRSIGLVFEKSDMRPARVGRKKSGAGPHRKVVQEWLVRACRAGRIVLSGWGDY